MRRFAPVVFATLALATAACGDKPPAVTEDGGGSDGGDDSSCAVDDDCHSWEICEEQSCVDGDRNNGVDEAQSVLWEDSVDGLINPSGDKDYFALQAEGGEWVKITTTTDNEESNTVLTLRDPALKVVTASDDYPTGSSTTSYDSVIYAYLADAGTYIIEVEDDGTWLSDPEKTNGSKNYTYTLAVSQWSRVSTEVGTAESPSPTLEPTANTLYAVGVLLEEPGDVDFIGVAMPWGNTGMTVGGILDLTGSDLTPLVTLTDAEGTRLSTKADVGPDGSLIYPAMQQGDYLLTVSDAAGGGGPDYWSYLFVSIGDPDEAYPSEVEPNGEAVFAQELQMDLRTSSSGDYLLGHAQGWADGPGDVDWFSFPGLPGGDAVVCLNSENGGSTQVFDLGLYDSGLSVLGSDTGNAATSPNAAIENVSVEDGTYYLAVTAPPDAVGALDEWYRITVYVAEFSIGNYVCP